MKDFVTWQDIEDAYNDFLRHKRSTTSAYRYMQTALRDLPLLLQQINSGTYEISSSVAFCATRPKLREVFAASPRDRIVHHLLILKFGDMFESVSIDASFNCRKGKGNVAMTQYVSSALSSVGSGGWVCKMDIKGCFMNIDKDVLWQMLSPKIAEWCNAHADLHNHTAQWIWLWHKIVYHRPESNCDIHGDATLFDRLPQDKTLFKSNGRGLAIGNLTSQILANFYFHEVDRTVSDFVSSNGGYYARYMDDIVIISPRRDVVLQSVHLFRQGIQTLHLRLNPRKFYLQRAYKSFSLVGYVFCHDRIYISNRTVGNAMRMCASLAKASNVQHAVSRINSYFGFMRPCKSYAIRWRLWNAIPDNIKQHIYSSRMKSVHLI